MFPLLLNKFLSTLRPPPAARPTTSRGAGFAGPGRTVHLALQGGGAHGAFTWGVLDQLLADGRLAIGSVSGTSAGAVNAVVLADGLARGGAPEAQQRLAEFWRAASFDGSLPQLQRDVIERLFSFLPQGGSPMPWLGAISGILSPYEINPLNINPLKDLIERFVDFERIRSGERAVFVSATNVETGDLRVFAREEMSAEAVMASACLPLLFRAVEIDGASYWDGGYSGNPAIFPLLETGSDADILIVQINPLRRRKVPTTSREITARVQEISFNAPLLAELRALRAATGDGSVRLHRIVMDDLGESHARSKLHTDFEFFEALRKRGQRATRRFLDAHAQDIGERSTIDVTAAPRAEVA